MRERRLATLAMVVIVMWLRASEASAWVGRRAE